MKIGGGNSLYVLKRGKSIAGFACVYVGERNIPHVGHFELGNSLVWLGPQFVHRRYRGLGLQKFLLLHCMDEQADSIDGFVTCINAGNKRSLHSFSRLGFQQGGWVTDTGGLFSLKRRTIKINPDASNYIKIS